jgi:hypothetical protein
MIMSQPSHSKLNLQRMTEQRNELRALLQDAYDIISAQHDPDCEAFQGRTQAQWRRVSDLLWRPFAMDFEIPDSYPDCCYRNKPTYLSRCHRTITAIATVMPRTNIVR